MRKLLSLVLICLLLFASVVRADGVPSGKNEVVYGLLDANGGVDSIYVVNVFDSGEVVDYGAYVDVRNMTTADRPTQSGDEVRISTKADKLYYQGTLESKALPWDIRIGYTLDGNEVSAAELGGASGALAIHASVGRNPDTNSTFFDNYALQIALSLDNKLCDNIVADNATIADAGVKKQIAYTVLPGQGIDFVVTADVRDFEMDAISINGIRMAFPLDFDTSEFTGQLSELTDAIAGLDDGAAQLRDGATQLSDGMRQYADGVKAYADGMAQLSDGAKQLSDGMSELSGGLRELSNNGGALVEGALAIQASTFDAINAQLEGRDLGLPTLTPENYAATLSGNPLLRMIKQQLDGIVQFTDGVKAYTGGVTQISNGAAELSGGLSELDASTATVAAGAKALYDGAVEIHDGIQQLRDGLAQYQDGTGQFRSETANMDGDIADKIDQMIGDVMGNGEEVVSFVSKKNTNVSAVQFVLKTDAIHIPVIEQVADPKPAALTFWQKLLQLFGLYS